MAGNLPSRQKARDGDFGGLKGGGGCLTGRAMWSGSCVRGLRFVLSAWDAVEGTLTAEGRGEWRG